MPQVSVIMSVYREKPEWLMASIKSILRQTYTDFEFIIIVDDPKNVVLIKIVKTFNYFCATYCVSQVSTLYCNKYNFFH